MKVSTFEVLVEHPGYGTHYLADDGAPGAVLLLVAVVVDPLELLVVVFNQSIQRAGARVAGLIDPCRCGLHALHNRQGRKMSEKIGVGPLCGQTGAR
jgi:hypothetical protein